MNIDTESSTSLGGEPVIHIYLKRHLDGLRVTVKTTPDVEEFFRELCGGVPEAVRNYGRNWTPLGPEPLTCWSPNARPIYVPENEPFVLDKVGASLTGKDITGPYGERINLSFLRLVGVSSPEGVTFTVQTVLSKEELVGKLSKTLQTACKNFYEGFIAPAEVSITVIRRQHAV